MKSVAPIRSLAANPASAPESALRLPSGRSGRAHSSQSGFAYFLALALVAITIIASAAVLENLAIQGRRNREQETIWRGNQYVRAIRLFYHKTGRYPTSLEDLEEAVPDLHFIRQMYKDPMNHDDGKWRLIWVNAAGQIIGSVHYASLQQMALLDLGVQGLAPGQQIPGMQIPGQPGIPVSSLASGAQGQPGASGELPPAGPFDPETNAPTILDVPNGAAGASNPAQGQGQSPVPGQTLGPAPDQSSDQNSSQSSPDAFSSSSQSNQSAFGQSGQSGFGGSPMQNGQSGLGAPTGQNGANGLSGPQQTFGGPNAGILQQKPTGPVDGPVLGAFITGVASNVDRNSVRILHGGKKYKDWEFIWNPLEDQARAMQQNLSNPTSLMPGQPGAPANNLNQSSPGAFGSQPGPTPSQPQQ
jgi:hypothetical protein